MSREKLKYESLEAGALLKDLIGGQVGLIDEPCGRGPFLLGYLNVENTSVGKAVHVDWHAIVFSVGCCQGCQEHPLRCHDHSDANV